MRKGLNGREKERGKSLAVPYLVTITKSVQHPLIFPYHELPMFSNLETLFLPQSGAVLLSRNHFLHTGGPAAAVGAGRAKGRRNSKIQQDFCTATHEEEKVYCIGYGKRVVSRGSHCHVHLCTPLSCTLLVCAPLMYTWCVHHSCTLGVHHSCTLDVHHCHVHY